MKKPSQLQQGTKLADQLDTYSASVRANQTAGLWSKRIQRWTPYAAAVGSSLALTTAAEADIIYNSSHTSVSVGNGTAAALIAMQAATLPSTHGAGVFSLRIRHGFSSFFNIRQGSAKVIHPNFTNGGDGRGGGLIANGSGFLLRLASGAKISAGANFQGIPGPLKYLRNNPYHNVGTWGKSSPGFAGIYFKTKGGQKDFGWIRLEWTADSHGFPAVLVDDFAYDNTGAPINAGQETVAPEPSSLLLTMLAAGSAGVMAWRKRRQAAKDAVASATA